MKALYRAVEGEMSIGDFTKFKRDSEERVLDLINEINNEFQKQGVEIRDVQVDVYEESNFGPVGGKTQIAQVKFEVDF